MGRGKSSLEESHEKQQGTVWKREPEKGGGDRKCGAGATACGRRSSRARCSRLNRTRGAGETNDNDTRQILLQHQSAESGGAGASSAIGREIAGAAKGDRGDSEGLRISVPPDGHIACRAGGVGRRGKQVLPVL